MKITVTQAVEERKYLIKRIYSLIQRAEFVRCDEGAGKDFAEKSTSMEEWKRKIEISWNNIQYYIERYQKLEQLLLEMDAKTMIKTSAGTISVSAALMFKRRLEGCDFEGVELEFEEQLFRKIRQEYKEKMHKAQERGYLLIDPLKILRMAEDMIDDKNKLLKELTTKIQLSNADTWIEIEEEKHVPAD